MIVSILYLVLAILGLSFLIFIHELGHYYMAKRVGMKVETFSIGFGKPIYSWIQDGVKWQIGWLLFGGYVKIAGMENENEKEFNSSKDGFYDKPPIDRIKVAFMGPCINLLFAFLVFALLWTLGGREKKFTEFTPKIGWMDTSSALYSAGVRPGDEIVSYDKTPFQSFKDHLYAPLVATSSLHVEGFKVDPFSGSKQPFALNIHPYPHPLSLEKGILTTGILNPASYLIYDRLPNGNENPLPENSPAINSGLEYGDRLIWANGEVIYSIQELSHIINDTRALLTIHRNGQILQRRVPRVLVQELKLGPAMREEIMDWQFAALLNGIKTGNLYAIPYNLTSRGIVENELKLIDRENQEAAFPLVPFSPLDQPLEEGDQIIAVDGKPVNYAFEILAAVQIPRVQLIVLRNPIKQQGLDTKSAEKDFESIPYGDLNRIVNSIGTDQLITSSGPLVLLNTIIPKRRLDFSFSDETKEIRTTEVLEQKKEIESIEDPEKRAQALHLLENQERQYLIGVPFQDKNVKYNPNPLQLFYQVFDEIWKTLEALFTGSLNPRWISGPIGIVQLVHDQSMASLKEALYWLGAISLNLGVLNLLPIPVLDGGTIAFSFIEMITKKKMKPKTMEKLVIPFAFLLIGLFIYLTYNDIVRVLGKFLHIFK